MDSIIRTIVDMDKRARKRTMEEKEFFDRADSELAERAKQIEAEEQARAEKEIAENAARWDAKLKEALDDISAQAEKVSAALDEKSKLNFEKWVEELAQRAVR